MAVGAVIQGFTSSGEGGADSKLGKGSKGKGKGNNGKGESDGKGADQDNGPEDAADGAGDHAGAETGLQGSPAASAKGKPVWLRPPGKGAVAADGHVSFRGVCGQQPTAMQLEACIAEAQARGLLSYKETITV